METKASSVTAAELADLLGVTSKTVYQLADRGIVIRAGRGRRARPGARPWPRLRRPPVRVSLGALADKAELANAHRRGALVDAEAVQREWCDTIRGVRARVMAVPTRCGARLPHLTAHDISTIEGEVARNTGGASGPG